MRLSTSRTSWGWSNLALSPNLSRLSLSGSPQGVGKEGSEPGPRSWMEMRRGKGSEGEGGHPCPHRDLDRNCPLWAVGTPLTSLCREGEGWERKTQFFGGKETPPGHGVLQGLGDPAGKRDKIPLKHQAGTGWELPTLLMHWNFFPSPCWLQALSSRCLGLGGSGSMSSQCPGMSPHCHLAQSLGGHPGGTSWLGSCFSGRGGINPLPWGGNSTDPAQPWLFSSLSRSPGPS